MAGFGLWILVRHVKLDGEIMRLAFPANAVQKMQAEVTDAALAAVSAELLERTPFPLPGLAGRSGRSAARRSTSTCARQPGETARRRTSAPCAAPSPRPRRWLRPGRREREAKQAVRAAVVAASEVLGNTPTVTKGSRLNPRSSTATSRGRRSP